MKISDKLPELLAPAGDMKALMSAISAGADAIYIGGKRFGARAFAKNFDEDELKAAVKICHASGVRLYVTVNTLIYEKEIEQALEYVGMLSKLGVDAVIVCDLGLAALIKEKYPALELHASTQMGIHNSLGADQAYSLGCERVVLARECSFKDIKAITEKCKPEIEIFVHGALCVCHSGQCLFSSLVGGRSGNRGECAQPCRLPYANGKYPLSLKDLTLASHIREIISAGVASLKIEGRMKSAEYVYTVTRIFRRLLDEGRNATARELSELERAFSRDGFTDGYFTGKTESAMTGVRTAEDKRASRTMEIEAARLPGLRLCARAKFKRGIPSELTLSASLTPRWHRNRQTSSEICATAAGDIPTDAITSPLDADSLKMRLCKMGNTPFELMPKDIELELDEGLNMPVSAINALRRAAAEDLESRLLEPLAKASSQSAEQSNNPAPEYSHILSNAGGRVDCSGKIIASFRNVSLLLKLIRDNNRLVGEAQLIFVVADSLFELAEAERKLILASVGAHRLGIMLPPVISESELPEVYELVRSAAELGISTCLAGNIGHLPICRRFSMNAVADIRLNVFNPYTLSVLKHFGVEFAIPSAELTVPQVRDIGGFIFAMGRVPLMLTERCFIKENFGCDKCGRAELEDRRGAKFPIIREYGHRNIILNSALTYMGDKCADIDRAALGSYICFTNEDFATAKRIISAYLSGAEISSDIRRIGKR